MTTKIDLTNITDTALTTLTGPKVTTIVYPGTETATDTAGGETINLTGNGFQSGCSVLVGSTAASVVTFISTTQISFTAPAMSANTYVIYVINPDGGTAISIPGISYSGTPNWTTSAGSLGSAYETGSISTTVTATGDAPITYTLASGTLPTGSTLSGSGSLSGTAPSASGSTTYSFTITAKDAQNQTTNRAFTLTINPDVVTWSAPADNSTTTVYEYTAISNVAMSATSAAGKSITYTANSLPTGLSITGANIAGTPTVVGSTSTLLTGTSATTNKTATRTVNFVVNQDVVTWSAPTNNSTTTVYEYDTITPVTLSATSAAGKSITYSANSLPTGVTLSGSSISGTPTVAGSTSTLLTGTAATTNRTATRTVNFVVNQDVVTWSSPADNTTTTSYTNSPIANVTMSASSAAGRSITYTANALPTGLSISGANITGTPTVAASSSSLITATASTTNRTATRTFNWVISVTNDTYWKNTTLLLNGETTVTPFISDASTNNLGLTIAGDTKPNNFSPYSYGYYSWYVPINTAYLASVPVTSADLGSGNFTIELWFNTEGITYSSTLINAWSAGGSNSYEFFINGSKLQFYDGSNIITSANGVLTIGSWYHAAAVRSGSTITLYLNGVSVASGSSAATFTPAGSYVGIGGTDSSQAFGGYISNIRIVKGTAVYTSTFTPSTVPLTAISGTVLLTAQSNGFIDNSPLNNIVTRSSGKLVSTHPFAKPTTVSFPASNSMYFDASTATYVTYTGTSFGTGAFTAETWYYIPTTGISIVGYIFYSTGANAFRFQLNGSTSIRVVSSGLTTQLFTVPSWQNDTWYHIVYTRDSSGNATIFVNGTRSSTGVVSDTNNYSGVTDQLGGATGKIFSNVRFVKGTNVYDPTSSTITVPTSPLTAVSGTQLLTFQNNTLIDNSINNYALTMANTTSGRILAFNPFAGSSTTTVTSLGSAYFDGTGDYLTIPHDPSLNFGIGSFTIECWIFLNTIGVGTNVIFSKGVDATSGFVWQINSSNQIQIIIQNTSYSVTDFTLTNYNWYHVVITRDTSDGVNGYVYAYVNGVRSAAIVNWTYGFVSTANAYIGTNRAASTSFNGYISDLRLVNGSVIYINNFLPTKIPLSVVTNTQLLTLQYNGGANNQGIIDNSNFNNIVTRAGNTTQGTFSPYSVTGFSTYYNGTTDYQPLPTNAAFAIGTSDFTVECWVMPTGPNLIWSQIFAGVNYGSSSDWGLYASDANTPLYPTFYFTSSGTPGNGATQTQGSQTLTGYTKLIIGQWNHIAVSRVSGTARMFINGVQTGPSVNASTWSLTNTLQKSIAGGYNGNSNTLFTGYISNLRVISGTGLYTTTFTPSTVPLTPIAGTILLTNQSNRFIDNGLNNFALTTGGTPSIQAYSPFGSISEATPLSYSNYFNGSTDYFTTPSSGTALYMTGNWTIEFWINSTQTSRADILCANYTYTSTGWFMISLGLTGSTSIDYCETGGGAGKISGTLNRDGLWHHVALTKSGTSMKLFIDGTQTGSTYTTSQTQWGSSGNGWIIGDQSSSSTYYQGYISNLRVVNGTAVYTATFTPSTTPLTVIANTSLLTCQSTTIKDNSTNSLTITTAGSPKVYKYNPFGYTAQSVTVYTPSIHGGSAYFDGTDDKLTIASYPSLSFGANDFTIQAWFYTKVASTEQVIATNGWASYAPWLIRINASNQLMLNMSTNGGAWYVNEAVLATVTPGQWYHVAVTRANGTLIAFTNGVQSYTASFGTTALYNGSQALNVGGRSDTSVPFNGYITDVQLINGYALYTSNFVPPTSPATATNQTTFLCNFTNGGIVDQHSSFVLETVGNAQLSTSIKKYNNASMYFDGTGDYCVSTPINQLYAFGTGDLTIEAWIYRTDTGVQRGIVDTRDNSSVGILFFINSNNKLNLFDGTSVWLSSTNTVAANQWVHVAASRASGTTKLFINGAQEASGADTRAYTAGSAGLYIARQYGSTTNDFMGYIDDLRITKGYARYTSAFTAPTSALITK